eukprot:88164_1
MDGFVTKKLPATCASDSNLFSLFSSKPDVTSGSGVTSVVTSSTEQPETNTDMDALLDSITDDLSKFTLSKLDGGFKIEFGDLFAEVEALQKGIDEQKEKDLKVKLQRSDDHIAEMSRTGEHQPLLSQTSLSVRLHDAIVKYYNKTSSSLTGKQQFMSRKMAAKQRRQQKKGQTYSDRSTTQRYGKVSKRKRRRAAHY